MDYNTNSDRKVATSHVTINGGLNKKTTSNGTSGVTPANTTAQTQQAAAAPTPEVSVAVPPPEVVVVDVDQNEKPKTSAATTRRGRIQREKRMLRQKRRSTGVVNLKDLNGAEEAASNNNNNSANKGVSVWLSSFPWILRV